MSIINILLHQWHVFHFKVICTHCICSSRFSVGNFSLNSCEGFSNIHSVVRWRPTFYILVRNPLCLQYKSTYSQAFYCELPINIIYIFSVQINQLVDVRAKYVSPSTSWTFNHCLSFQQNGMILYFWYWR